MRRFSIGRATGIVLLILACLSVGSTASAQTPPSPRSALGQLVVSPQASPDWFDAAFLAQVSISQVQSVLDGIRSSLGAYQSIEGSGSSYTLRFERGTIPATIALNSSGRISTLVFGTPSFADRASAFAQSIEALKQLPGKVSLLITKDGKEQASIEPGLELAVGSAFKLAVMSAVKKRMDSGKLAWDDVFNLRPSWQSLPSGLLQAWPPGSALTLQTLASLMISLSDNTAADGLIDLVGRNLVERYSGQNKPLMTTREAFVLKSTRNGDLRTRYINGTEADRRDVLSATASRPLPAVADLDPGTEGQKIEWFFDTRELCRLIDGVSDLPVMHINPGVADPDAWRQVAFKGGSDSGVINLTHLLVAADGARWCVAATWNADEAGEDQFVPLIRSLLANLS